MTGLLRDKTELLARLRGAEEGQGLSVAVQGATSEPAVAPSGDPGAPLPSAPSGLRRGGGAARVVSKFGGLGRAVNAPSTHTS